MGVDVEWEMAWNEFVAGSALRQWPLAETGNQLPGNYACASDWCGVFIR